MGKTIKITESDLHRLVKESVKRVLMEGKVVNHKPMFYYYKWDRENLNKKPIKPGEYVDDWTKFDNKFRSNYDKRVMKGMDIHNKRHGNYDSKNNLVGTKEYQEKEAEDKRIERRCLVDLLKHFKMSARKFASLPEWWQNNLWEDYWDWRFPRDYSSNDDEETTDEEEENDDE